MLSPEACPATPGHAASDSFGGLQEVLLDKLCTPGRLRLPKPLEQHSQTLIEPYKVKEIEERYLV